MSLVERYINPDSTPGGNGTTSSITPSDPNRAYASGSEWDANEATDLVADLDQHLAHCAGAANDSPFVIDDADWTTDTTYTLTLHGDNRQAKYNTSAYRVESGGGGYAILVQVDAIFEYIQTKTELTTIGYVYGIVHDGSLLNLTLNGCISDYAGYVTQPIQPRGCYLNNTLAALNAYNCIFTGWDGGSSAVPGYGVLLSNGTLNTINTVTGNCNTGIRCTSAINCATPNCTTEFASTPTIDYCASIGGVGTNAVTVTSWADEFVDPANDDYTLKLTSDLKDTGVDKSALFTNDIQGNTRPTGAGIWDIGADEYVSGGASYSISGDTVLNIIPESSFDYTLNASLPGDVVLQVIPEAVMVFQSGYSIVGDAVLSITPEGTFQYNLNASLNGDAVTNFLPEAGFLYTLNASINGDHVVTILPEAVMQFLSGGAITDTVVKQVLLATKSQKLVTLSSSANKSVLLSSKKQHTFTIH